MEQLIESLEHPSQEAQHPFLIVMFIAFYITDSKNSLVYQYLLSSNSPLFTHLLARIRAVCPSLLSQDEQEDDESLRVHCSVARDLEIFKYHSVTNNLNFYCLASGASCKPDTDPYFFMEQMELLLLQYFDKDQLTVTKLINNFDRITMIFYTCIDAGEPAVGTLDSNRIKRIIPIKSDLSKVINKTAHSLQRAVRHQGPGILAPLPEVQQDQIVPWRSGNLRYASDEIYVDVVETVHVIYQAHHRRRSQVQLVCGTINGHVNVKSYLSGNPTVEMQIDLADHEIYAPTYHECVEPVVPPVGKLHFIPPDGMCRLLDYTIDLDMPHQKTGNNLVGMVSLSYHDSLGQNKDEFEIHLNISSSSTVPYVQNLAVQLELQEHCSNEDFKIKILRNTHGRFDNSVHPGRGSWIFDKQTSMGALPVLRGCVENASGPVKVQRCALSYQLEGQLPSGIRLSALNVRSSSTLRSDSPNKLYKGVKYVCRTADFEIRSI
ncbi:related to AP-3 complex subunit mu [Zygosaccharomyces bailii]|nr:related to AP-3 complex subunit mu [Zygosaccharomyces bailii]